MSKKTDAIYECIKKLEGYENNLSNFLTTCDTETEKALSDVDFGIKQEIRTLRFWIDSLYKYNGRSTSVLKKSASKENGKKGGRPPKEVTEARRHLKELDNDIIPSLEKEMMNSDSNEKIREIEEKIEKAKEEKDNCENILFEYKREKELNNAISRL